MKKPFLLVVIFTLLLSLVATFTGCASGAESTQESGGFTIPGAIPAPTVVSPESPSFFSGKGEEQGDVRYDYDIEDENTIDRIIVRSGNISLIVADVAQTQNDITALASSLNGYVVSSNIWGEDENTRSSISIRVPAESFDTAMDMLSELAINVQSKSSNAQDVTEEYVDLESRLSNAEATEAQFLSLLDRANDVEDILIIYERLSQIRGEIEQIKGRMQYLESTASMSQISISLRTETSAGSLVSYWSAGGVFSSALRGLITFGQWLLSVAIWLVIFSPLWGLVVLIIILIRRRIRAKRARKLSSNTTI